MPRDHKNPLLEPIPHVQVFSELIGMLIYDPLDEIDISKLSEMDRNEKLVSAAIPFEPTAQSIRIAATILGMIRGGYLDRDPTIATNRERRAKLLALELQDDLFIPEYAYGHASALVLKGITGTGKTVLVNQLLASIPKIKIHEKNEKAGWNRCSQITYLQISMSHDGTRGGLAMNILQAIDNILFTTYAKEIAGRKMSIEKQLVKIISLLHAMYVGVIVIDEIQQNNMVTSAQSKLMQSYLILILNTGIPIVFIGNPLGFSWVNKFSQGLRRLKSNRSEYIHPCEPGSQEWESVFIGVKRYYVLDVPIGDEHELSEKLSKYSGGVPDLALNLWKRAQLLILFGEVTDSMSTALDIAYEDEDFDELRVIADAFTTKNAELLVDQDDIPHQYYRRIWKENEEKDETDRAKVVSQQKSSESPITSKKSPMTDKSKLMASQTRERNKENKRKKLRTQLEGDDIRIGGIKNVLLTGLNDTLKSIDEKR